MPEVCSSRRLWAFFINFFVKKEGVKNMIIWSNREINGFESIFLPTYPGIYVYTEYNKNTESYDPYYVGKAINIRNRHAQHISGTEKNTCLQYKIKNSRSRIYYANIQSEIDRSKIESALYDIYRVKYKLCNSISPELRVYI